MYNIKIRWMDGVTEYENNVDALRIAYINTFPAVLDIIILGGKN